jgi:protein arginine kinase activator
MLCQKCKKNEANFYYKKTVNGNVKEIALCNECVTEMGITNNMFDIPMFNMMNEFNPFKSFNNEGSLSTPKVCTLCGSSFNDIIKSGKAGCAKCYDVFRGEFDRIITNIHGKVTHNGRAPKEFKIKNDKMKKLTGLKNKLSEVIAAQEFEQAAKIRDEINMLEGEDKQ